MSAAQEFTQGPIDKEEVTKSKKLRDFQGKEEGAPLKEGSQNSNP